MDFEIKDTFLKDSDFNFFFKLRKKQTHFFKSLGQNMLWFDFIVTSYNVLKGENIFSY